MRRLSTQCAHGLKNETKDSRNHREGMPSRQTLDYLFRFARCYHVEPALESRLCGYVMN